MRTKDQPVEKRSVETKVLHWEGFEKTKVNALENGHLNLLTKLSHARFEARLRVHVVTVPNTLMETSIFSMVTLRSSSSQKRHHLMAAKPIHLMAVCIYVAD